MAQEMEPRLPETQKPGTPWLMPALLPLNNGVSTSFQKMLGGSLGGHCGPLHILSIVDRLLQHRGKPEPGRVQDHAGTAVAFCLWAQRAFQWFLTALIPLAEDPCVLPVGSCGFFLSCKWRLLELVTQGGFIFRLPGDR